MEVAIVLGTMVVVVAAKGLTSLWLSQKQRALKEVESERKEVSQKQDKVEAAKLQLERDKQAIDREEKLLENEKDLISLEIKKLGGTPIPEDELDAMDAVSDTAQASGPAPQVGAEVAVKEAEEPTAEEKQEETSKKPAKSDKYRILVVDDNNDLRELLHQVLSRKYEVESAVDGYEALTKIRKEKQVFDLVITDLKMPNVNGVKLVKNLPKGVPTIIVSGFLQRDEFRKAIEELKPVAMIEKPFKMAEIRQAIKKAFQEHGE